MTRLRLDPAAIADDADSLLVDQDEYGATFVGVHGLVAIDGASASDLDGDVVLVDPLRGRAERILRSTSFNNTLLVTERCDQLCVMCSQPPKKTHDDRFAALEAACLLVPQGMLIGISGGEPTLYKEELLGMIERVLSARGDLQFHVLSNAQHFAEGDVERLRQSLYARVSWGIPLYASDPQLHDEIVGKTGAFERLHESFAWLLAAGARIELRTVLLTWNLDQFPTLARYVAGRFRFIEAWSIMQLEHIGYAKGRWRDLMVRHDLNFALISKAVDSARARGIHAQLFNFPRCTVPEAYRDLAVASISDWKKKLPPPCGACREQSRCSGFFEWHPDEDAHEVIRPL